MEVSLPQTMLQKLLDLLKLESLKFCLKIHVHVIRHIRCQVDITSRYLNQHESAPLIGLFHATSSVLPSVESYRNYRKPTQRGVQGYFSSLQLRVHGHHGLKKNCPKSIIVSSSVSQTTNIQFSQ